MNFFSKLFGSSKKGKRKGKHSERTEEKLQKGPEDSGIGLQQEGVSPLKEKKVPEKDIGIESQLTQPIQSVGDDGTVALQKTVFEIESPKDRAEKKKPAEDKIAVEWNIGDVILDLYDVTDILGKGGMGKVYKVHHRKWNRDLAVKSPLPNALSRVGGKENFVLEAETWVNLGLHPNIVSCHYVRVLGDIPRVFAEFVEGGSLKEWISSGKLYEGGPEKALERMLDIAIQFAWGLDYAHEQGLVHQDIKPDNVMMTAEGTAKITDFGLARARPMLIEKLVQESGKSILVTKGGMTEEYCSPEQYAGKRLSRKTDIWSWGVSILEMFTGERTWRFGFTAAKALEAYIEYGNDDPSIPLMPTSVSELLKRCFQNDPEHRQATMADVADGLKSIYQEVTGSAFDRPVPKAAEFVADGLNNQGVSYFELGRKEDAIACFEQALKVNQLHLEATYNLGLIQWREAEIADDEVLRRLGNCGNNPAVDPEKLAELKSFIHAERLDFSATKNVLKGIPGRYEKHFSGKDVDQIGCIRVIEGHKDCVASVAISPDGRYAVSGSNDKTVRVWELATGRCVRTLDGHTHWVLSVAFTPDGRYAVSGSFDKTVRVWELATGRCLHTLEGHTNGVHSIAFTPDGRYAVSGSADNILRVWELASGRCVHTLKGHHGSVNSVAITPDGRYAVSGSWDMTLGVWELAIGRCVRILRGHTNWVYSVSITPDGRYAVSGSADYNLRVWELASGLCVRTLEGHRSSVSSLAITPDGRYAVSGSFDKTVRVWELATGRCLRTLEIHSDELLSVAITLDGRNAVSGSADKTILVWKIFPDYSYMADLQLSLPKGFKEIKKEADAFNKAISQARMLYRKRDYHTSFSVLYKAWSDANFSDNEVMNRIYSSLIKKGKVKGLHFALQKRLLKGHTDAIRSVAITPDGRYAVSELGDKALRVWELATGQCVHILEGHTRGVGSVAVTPDSRYAVSGSDDKTVRVWELATGRCVHLLKGHTWYVTSVALSPDGRYAVSGSWDKTLRVWELSSGRCIHTLEGHTHNVDSVVLSPDGRYAVSSDYWDKTLRVWELATGQCVHILEGHTRGVGSVVLSPDGRYAVSGSYDKTLRVWDLATGRCIRTLEGHTGEVYSVAITPDGRYAVSGSGDKTLRVWELIWDLEFPDPVDWNEGVKPYLEIFLTLNKRKWNEEGFTKLIDELASQRGYGWVRPEGIRRELEKMTQARS